MPLKIKTTVIIYPALFLILLLFSSVSYCDMSLRDRGNFGSVPGPTLLFPVTDDIALNGKGHLEFKWSRGNFVDTDHFEFRLYKGYNAIGSTLILKENIPTDTYPIRVPASQFEVNQVYTWSLVQVFTDGEKSGPSFGSFKITGK